MFKRTYFLLLLCNAMMASGFTQAKTEHGGTELDTLASTIVTTINLALECKAIPRSAEQICVATTSAEFNAVDDVVFYRRTAEQQLTLLRVEYGDVAVVWLHGFSVGGKYTIVGYAEEGHPSFMIYSTAEFLTNNKNLKPVAVISDYFIASLDSLDDRGLAQVTFLNNLGCDEAETANCSGQLNIFEQN